MKNLEIKTRSGNKQPQHKQNLNIVTTFLRHSEDRITVISGETVNLEIYENGKLIFAGDKHELHEQLKK